MSSFNSDSLPEKDLLERRNFAQILANSLLRASKNTSTSLVVGLNGAWGTGKTTLLEFMKQSLLAQTLRPDDLVILEFNPWRYSQISDIQSTFMVDLSRQFAKDNRLRKAILSLSKLLSSLEFVKQGGPITAITHGSINKLFEYLSKNSVDKVKDEVSKILIKKKAYLFVLIDDLDRLTPKEIVEVFQLIKLNGNFSNTVFLVAYDKLNVKIALEREFGIDGEKYLDKIIQVDYKVPEISEEKIFKIFQNNLEELLSRNNIKYDIRELNVAWRIKRFNNYFVNLRDVYRFSNALELTLPIMQKDVCITDFIIIEAIRVFDFSSYSKIVQEYPALVRFSTKDKVTIIDGLTKDMPNATRSLVRHLFLEQVGQVRKSNSQYSIGLPDNFDRYTTFSLKSNEVAESEFDLFIEAKTDRLTILKKLIEENRIASLFSKLQQTEQSLDLEMIDCLLQVWESKPQEFEKYTWDVWDSVFKIAETSETPTEAVRRITHPLFSRSPLFNPAAFFLHCNIVRAIDFPELGIQIPEKLRPMIVEICDRLRNELQAVLDANWHSFMVSRRYLVYKSLFNLFVICAAHFNHKSYSSRIRTYLNEKENLIQFLSVLVLIDSRSGEAFRLSQVDQLRLLPEDTYMQFIQDLKKISKSTVESIDWYNIQFFLKAISEVE